VGREIVNGNLGFSLKWLEFPLSGCFRLSTLCRLEILNIFSTGGCQFKLRSGINAYLLVESRV
jgi:hypothetical protein